MKKRARESGRLGDRVNGSDARTISCSKEFSQATSTAKIDKGEIFVFICHKFVFVQLVISLK